MDSSPDASPEKSGRVSHLPRLELSPIFLAKGNRLFHFKVDKNPQKGESKSEKEIRYYRNCFFFFGYLKDFLPMLVRILLAITRPGLRKKITNLLPKQDVIVHAIDGKKGLWERLSKEGGDLVIASRDLIVEPMGDTVNLLRESPESPDVVIITDHEGPEERARLLAAGCEAVLFSGLQVKILGEVLEALLRKRREITSKRILTRRPWDDPRLSDFVSASPAMQTFMAVAERVAASDSSLLILGETGVGKERLARAIHAESRRSKGPFITVNCGALPDSLLESELFGHEEGAFTGAIRSRRGWFELAHGGTVFLDEIGEMPLHLQVKLLRVLQDHEIQRIGSEKPFPIDVRVMAATNRNLEEEVEKKDFRRDLYYRLGVITLTLPPLRERIEDIPSLAESYVDYFSRSIGRAIDGIEPDALDALLRYPWPGNVRELANVIERAVLLTNESKIALRDLPVTISGEILRSVSPLGTLAAVQESKICPEDWIERPMNEVRRDILEEFEKNYLTGMLRRTFGRIGETARRAGITPRSLFGKMKQYGLRKEAFKKQPHS